MIFSKTNIKEEIQSKIKKLDVEKVINNDLIKDNVQILNGRMSGSTNEISRLVKNQYNSSIDDFMKLIDSMITQFVSDEVVDLTNRTLEAYNSKTTLETEINELRRQLSILINEKESNLIIIALENAIENKKEQLEEKENVYKQLYRESIKKTTLPKDLAELIKCVRDIEDDEKEKISKEVQLLRAKANALELLRIEIKYDTERMIEERINIPVALISCKAYQSSDEQIPLINILLK